MSSGGQVVGGIVGAAAGFVVGGPTGAIYGAQIGMSVGGLLDPPKGPTVEGPRLNDLSAQTSTYGQFIPRTYGTIGLSGNVFWLENNKIKEKVKKKQSGGKGGGSSSTVKTYTYYATFAVGLCEGPIAGVRRIWVGPDLVYDAGSDDLETIISSNQASSKFTIYTGTDTQQPDPRMQAEMGVANCPAFRGLAYIVVKDLKLTNYGNSVAGAQVKVEVVNSLSSSVKLAGSEAVDYYQPHSNPSFLPKPYFISEEKIVFYAPQWEATYPESSSFLKYTVGIGYSIPPISVPVIGGTGVPPNGDTDDESEYWKSGADVFAGATLSMFDGTGGYIQRRGDLYAGLTSHPDGRLYITKQKPGLPYISSAAKCFAISGDLVYAIEPSAIKVYDSELALVNSYSITIPAMSFPLARAEMVDGNFIIYDGGVTVYTVSADFSTVSVTATLPAIAPSSYYSISVNLSKKVFILAYPYSYITDRELRVEWYALDFITAEQIPLSGIFESESIRSAIIKLADVDASGLTDSVTGFKVTATGSIRNAIEPLRGAWPFDVVQSGYKIKATSRGSASVVTIPVGELAIDTQLTESREMDSQLPQNVTVKYIDRDRDYDQNEQRAQRDNTEAVNSLVLELPVVLSATQSAQVADKLIRIYALEKSDFSFTLPAPYRYLEPGDVVTIAAYGASYVLRLVSVNQTADGRLECAGRPSSASTYTSIAPGDGGQHGGTVIPLTGATIGILIDCPVIDEGLQNSPGFAVGMNGYSTGWPGGILYRTADNGQTWDDLQALEGRAAAGYASGVLSASAGNLIQRGGSLTVSLIGGTLESVTEAQMLNGANMAAYGVNGRWEILRFQNATLNGDGTYTLDTFWRGDKGTEWATGLHAANDIFVLMTDPDLAFVGMPTDSIGQPRDYRAVTAGADIDGAASQLFTYAGVNLETLSGVHPRGSRSAGDLTITWQRRTRVGGAWRDNVDASLGETSEAYEIDVMSGSTVKRTLSASTPSVLYTSAMQVTDFGSPQASVTVNIYQLSAVVGRGYKLEATL